MLKDLMTTCTHFKGPWWLLVSMPPSQRQGTGEEDLKHSSEKCSIAFRCIYCPLIFSISITPAFGFHYTPRYNELMKKPLKFLNHREKYTQKQRDSLFPLHFCLQSAQHCWTEAFAAKGKSEEQLCHPGSSFHWAHRHTPETGPVKRYSDPLYLHPSTFWQLITFLFTEDKCLQILLANI